MRQIINWFCDSGDGVCIGGGQPDDITGNSNKTMNNELTLDQLQSISGGGTETHWRPKMRDTKRFDNLKQLADSGELVKKMKYIPGEMYRIPGDMY